MLRADGTIDTRYSLMPFDIEGLIARARAGDVEAQLLLDLDWREPNQQAFATTATGVIPGRTATAIFDFTEASGNIVDEVASEVLVAAGGNRYQQKAVGFYNGTDAHSKLCIEGNNAVAKFASADTNYLDLDASTSFALLCVYRLRIPGGTVYSLGRKISATDGYWLDLNPTGVLTARTRVSSVIKDNISNTVGAAAQGEYAAVLWVIDRAAAKLRIATSAGFLEEDTLTAAADDLTNSAAFTLANCFGTTRGGMAYAAVFTGAEAEGLTQSHLDTFWTQYDQYTDPVLTTYSRASLVAPQVGDESGFGVRVAKVGSGQFAFGYDSTFAHASKLGMVHERAHTNLCKGSEEAATGADYADIGTPTLTSNALEAPDGTFTMNRIAASGGVEGRQQTIAVSASTIYTFSTHVRRGIDATNAFGELEVFDASNVATIDNVQIDLNTDDERVRPSIEIVTPVGCVSVEIRFKVDDGSDMAEWGWQYEEGHLSTYIPTSTATTATRVRVDAVLVNPGGNTYLQSDAGEVEVVLSHYNDEVTDTRYMFDTGAGNPDRTTLQVIADEKGGFDLNDSAGAAQVAISNAPAPAGGWNASRTVRGRWNSNNVLSDHTVHADMFIDAVRTEDAAATSTWTAGTGAANLEIAQARVANFSADGIVARTRIYNKPRPDVP